MKSRYNITGTPVFAGRIHLTGGKLNGLCAALCLVLYVPPLFVSGQSVPGAGIAEISFIYTCQGGFASNQFAVWIEDSGGRHVKTLFATKFTAEGGWKRRELSLPLWVRKSGVSGMTARETDALSGPTPKSGTLRYVWDGTDQSGAAASGTFRVCIEAILRNENSVLYTVDITPGTSGMVMPEPRYSGNSTAERGMIDRVTVSFRSGS